MTVVVDASVALKWVIDEFDSAAATDLLSEPLFAPELLLSECANGLWKSASKGDISQDEALRRIDLLIEVPLTLSEVKIDASEALAIGMSLDHAVYDCIYLACAKRLGGQMVTADRRFATLVSKSPDLAPHIRLLGA